MVVDRPDGDGTGMMALDGTYGTCGGRERDGSEKLERWWCCLGLAVCIGDGLGM